MTLDDIKKLATGSLLFSLDRIIAPRMINILYLLGLASISIWSINHLFASFSLGFGAGLWGLLEIGIFGLLSFVVLRVVCEAIIVFFKTNETAATAATQARPSMSLIDEVRDAIEELADEDQPTAAIEPPAKPKPATAAKPATKSSRKPTPRTAKRSPAAKSK